MEAEWPQLIAQAGFLEVHVGEFYLARQPGDPKLETVMDREPGRADA